MEKYFRTQEGEIVNIVNHTLEQIDKWPHLKIYIGTDSQSEGSGTKYVTCIVYRYGNRGAHFIYYKDETVRDCDRSQYMRLYSEGLRTLEVHDLLTETIPISVESIEFDYADITKTLSSKLVSAFKGYKNSVFKSGQMIACKAADHILRHPNIYK